jgi:hypothetical protein
LLDTIKDCAAIMGTKLQRILWGIELAPEKKVTAPKVIQAAFEELKGL